MKTSGTVTKLSATTKNGRRRSARRLHKKKLLAKHDGKCVYCKGTDNLTVDHIIPLSVGGNNTFANLQIACLSCNVRKSDKTHEEFLILRCRNARIVEYKGKQIAIQYRRRRK